MTVGIGTNVKNATLAGIAALIDGGGGAGHIKMYSTPRPATGVAITTQTLLADIVLNNPSFGTITGGSMDLSTVGVVQDAEANASGEAIWARFEDFSGEFVLDVDVGDLASGAEIKLPNTTITIGGLVNVVSGSISVS